MRAISPAAILALAVLAGSAMDATIKHLVQANHVLVVTFSRYLLGALFSAGVWLHAGAPAISAGMWRAHGLRGLLTATSGALFFWAIAVLPLAEVITLSFVGLLIIPFAAAIMIGERLRLSSLFAAALGFSGVIVATLGGQSAAQSRHHMLGIAAVLTASALFAVSMVMLRTRAQSDGHVIVGLLASLMPACFLVGPALVFSPPPNGDDWPMFLLLGAFAACFMSLLARAYAGAQAQQLAPIHYSELLWASLIGYFIFAETPRPQLYLGAALTVGACLYTAYDERRLAPKPKAAS